MALLKPVSEDAQNEAVVSGVAQSVKENVRSKQPSGLMAMLNTPSPKPKKKTPDEDQISLFDLLDVSA